MKKLILVLLVLTGCGTASQQAPVGNLVGYGDSITYGAYNGGVSFIQDIAAKRNYTPIIRAVSGTTMFSDNQYPELMVDTWGPTDVVFFTPGINDAGQQGSNAAYRARYEQALTEIVARLISLNQKAYIGTPIQVIPGSFYGSAPIELYANMNREVVAAAHSPLIILVDFNTGYIPTAQSDYTDGIHPVALGYQMMTNYFVQNF